MPDIPKIKRVEFAPGVLEELEQSMSSEELQAMMDEIKAKLEDGSLFSESTLINMDTLEEEDPELYNTLMQFEQQKFESEDIQVEPKKLH
jgi:hypothetical protein